MFRIFVGIVAVLLLAVVLGCGKDSKPKDVIPDAEIPLPTEGPRLPGSKHGKLPDVKAESQ
jgi:hypothetical protein